MASRFAAAALANIGREYPSKLDHVLAGANDALPPRALHPSFHGSFDWHSCVHMHWLLARVRRLFPALPERAAIDRLFDERFAPDAIGGELAYLQRSEAQTFERTYGWAWYLKLAQEIGRGAARRWSVSLAPLANAFATRYLDYLPRAQYPWRYGLHANSAFGLAFALDFARASGHEALATLCVTKARAWYADDRGAPAAWEPSGADFLSPTLMEAELMRRIAEPAAFGVWLTQFLPGFAKRTPETLFTPVPVSDRSDGQIVHLDGLNLSRAWCFRGIAQALPPGDPRSMIATAAADAHWVAGEPGLESGDYVGAHWLATYAMLALSGA
jgi:hypothetical protein